jgi:hypothetical protein
MNKAKKYSKNFFKMKNLLVLILTVVFLTDRTIALKYTSPKVA